MNQRQLN